MTAEKGWTRSDPLRHGESTKCRACDATVVWTYTPIKAYVTYAGRALDVAVGRGVDTATFARDLAEEQRPRRRRSEELATDEVASALLPCDGELHERWYWVVLSK